MSGTIMVVDDEPQIQKVLTHGLMREGYKVITCGDGEEVLKKFREEQLDLIILDVMLPKIDGFEVCKRIRQVSDIPIIMLSVKGDEVDKAMGFRLGADDYLTKPFSISELTLRVRAVLRRTLRSELGSPNANKSRLVYEGLVIDGARRTVLVNGAEVNLTAKEFDILWFLASHPERVFTLSQLAYQLWQDCDEIDNQSIKVRISRLRKKIESDPSNPRYIKTVWGVGYKFDPSGGRQ